MKQETPRPLFKGFGPGEKRKLRARIIRALRNNAYVISRAAKALGWSAAKLRGRMRACDVTRKPVLGFHSDEEIKIALATSRNIKEAGKKLGGVGHERLVQSLRERGIQHPFGSGGIRPVLDGVDTEVLEKSYQEHGYRLRPVAERFGVSLEFMRKEFAKRGLRVHRGRTSHPWTREILEAFVARGFSAGEIARMYGCGQASVRYGMKRLGVHYVPKPGYKPRDFTGPGGKAEKLPDLRGNGFFSGKVNGSG